MPPDCLLQRVRQNVTILIACAVGVAVVTATAPAWAEPADYVFAPYGDAGSRYFQYAAGAERTHDGTHEQAQTLSLGWQPASRWFTAVYAGWYREPGERFEFDAVSWLNHVALTSSAEGPVAVGAYLEVERSKGPGRKLGFT